MPAATARRSGFAADLVTLPNIVTLSRIALILLAGTLFFSGYAAAGMVLAVTGGLTDYLDGWLARRRGQVTRLGEILDQFCDIFFESLALYVAVALFHFLPLWILTVYLGREFWITSIRRFMAGHQMNIASSLPGKLKTNFLMWGFLPTFVSIHHALPGLEPWVGYLGRVGIIGGLVLGYISGVGYTREWIVGYDRIAKARAAKTAVEAPALRGP